MIGASEVAVLALATMQTADLLPTEEVPSSEAPSHSSESDPSLINADSDVIEADVQWLIPVTKHGLVVPGKAHLRNPFIDDEGVAACSSMPSVYSQETDTGLAIGGQAKKKLRDKCLRIHGHVAAVIRKC